jgi:AraC-like DNA-binding protein
MASLDLALRIVGLVLLGSLCTILIRTRARDLKAFTMLGLGASVSAFLLTSMPHASALFGVTIYPLTALCSTHPVWFWLASGAMFSDAKALTRLQLASLVAMACLGVLYQSALPVPPAEAAAGVKQLGVVFGLASLAFACLAPVTVLLGMAGDLDARRRAIRKGFVPIVSVYLALVVAVQLIVLMRGGGTPKPLVLLNLLLIDTAAAVAVSTFVRFRVVNWIEQVDGPPPVALSRLEQSVLDRLNARFVPEKLYARTALGIGELAELLGTQEHVLRRVINRGLGFRSFSDFLHSHRLPEAARRLRDPVAARVPVLTIALEVGYGSIGPFNRAFRERFGMTPTAYRRAPFAETARFRRDSASPPAR